MVQGKEGELERGKQGEEAGIWLALSWEVPTIDSLWNYGLKKIARHGLFMRVVFFFLSSDPKLHFGSPRQRLILPLSMDLSGRTGSKGREDGRR